MSEGKKFDNNKLRVSIPEALPMEYFYGSFSYGAKKYNESARTRNYKKVSDPDIRYDDAGERHRLRRLDDETFDLESGLPHNALELFNNFCLLTLTLEKYHLTHADLQELLNTWGEIFSKPDFKLPDPRILALIDKWKKRVTE